MEERYKGIKITYNEDRNMWCVDDSTNGITLERESLVKARKAIDNALKKDKKGAYKRFEAWYVGGFGRKHFKKVTVTSKVENQQGFGTWDEYWISYTTSTGKKERSKVYGHDLYKINKSNDVRVAKISEIASKIAKLEKLKGDIESKMIRIDK